MSDAIKTALHQLDKTNDDHWTSDGQPRMDAVIAILGRDVTRKELIEAVPGFTRQTAPEPSRAPLEDQGKQPEEGENKQPQVNTDGQGNDESTVQAQSQDDENKQPGGGSGAQASSEDSDASQANNEDTHEVVEPSEEDLEQAFMLQPFSSLISTHENCEIACGILEKRIDAARKQYEDAKEEMDKLSYQNDLVTRAKINHENMDPNRNSKAIGAYLEASAEARAKRVANALQFVQGGTTAADVAAVLTPGSKLDQAMNRRKPPMGAVRPSYPPRAVATS